jgi:tetratricopeptide (TPR) repeat protein
VLKGLADVDFANGESQPALNKVRQVLALTEPLQNLDFWLEAKLLEARSLLALHQDAGDDARRFEELVPQFRQYKELGAGRAVDLEIFLGDYYLDRSEPARAVAWLQSAGKLAQELGLIDQQIEIHRKLGDLALRSRGPAIAIGEYRQAVRLVSAVSRSIPTDLAKVGYRGERSRAVAALVMALYDQYSRAPRQELLAEMLRTVEEGKSKWSIRPVEFGSNPLIWRRSWPSCRPTSR